LNLYHTTSWSNALKILRSGVMKSPAPFLSFSVKPLFSGDISHRDVCLVLDASKLRSQLIPVEYTERWAEEHPVHADYIAGEGWYEQFQIPDGCYDEEWGEEDEECVEEAQGQAMLDSFLWKKDEGEWVSKREYAPVKVSGAMMGLLVPSAGGVSRASTLLRDVGLDLPVRVSQDPVRFAFPRAASLLSPRRFKQALSFRSAVPEKYKGINFQPPESVAKAAEKGLEYRQKASPSNKGGLTSEEAGKEGIGSGVQRAVNLKNRDNIAPDTIKQMHGFFSRHQKNKGISEEHKGEPWNDKGYVSWLLWGGDPGLAWVKKILQQMEAADKKGPGKTARKEVLDENLIQRFRKDILALAKAADRVQSISQAQEVSAAVNRWREHFDSFTATVRQDLEGRIRSSQYPGRTSPANVQDARAFLDRALKPMWEFAYEVGRVPSSQIPVKDSSGNPWRPPEELFEELVRFYLDRGYASSREDAEAQTRSYLTRRPLWSRQEAEVEALGKWKDEARKWANRIRAKARKSWSVLGDLAEWSASLRGGQEPIPFLVPEEEVVSLSGFRVVFRGFEDSPYQDKLPIVRQGLALFRERSQQTAPIILQRMVPVHIQWNFEAGVPSSAGAYYERGMIHVTPWELGSDIRRFVWVMAHEMGHHLYQTVLSGDARKTWGGLIRGTSKDLDLRRALRKMESVGASWVIDSALKKADPILHLQLSALEYGPASSQGLDSAEDIRDYLEGGGPPVVRVPGLPISGYANKNPEESFCEALGKLVAFGPKAVPDMILGMLRQVLPTVRISSEKCAAATRPVGIPDRFVASKQAGLLEAPPAMLDEMYRWAVASWAKTRMDKGVAQGMGSDNSAWEEWERLSKLHPEAVVLSGPVQKRFEADLKGWKYGDRLEELIEKENADLLKKLQPPEGPIPDYMLAYIENMKRDILRSAKKPGVNLILSDTRGRRSAEFDPRTAVIEVEVSPKVNAKWIQQALQHEMRHYAQNLLSTLAGFASDKIQAGLPGKKIRTPDIRQQGQNRSQHSLDDREFYTKLPDAIERMREGLEALPIEERAAAFRIMVGQRRHDTRTYPLAFFYDLKRAGASAQGKYRKAIGEAYKAVAGLFSSAASRQLRAAWFKGSREFFEGDFGKPENAALWAEALRSAQDKHPKMPVRFHQGWAAKWYKEKGGEWTGDTMKVKVGSAGPTPTSETTFMEGRVYEMNLASDEFVHFTTAKRAASILRSKKLLLDPPGIKKFGGYAVYAISLVWGDYVPGTQTTHIDKDEGPVVAIRFRTDTMPKPSYSEEVTWNQDVVLKGPKLMTKAQAMSLLSNTPYQLGEQDLVRYVRGSRLYANGSPQPKGAGMSRTASIHPTIGQSKEDAAGVPVLYSNTWELVTEPDYGASTAALPRGADRASIEEHWFYLGALEAGRDTDGEKWTQQTKVAWTTAQGARFEGDVLKEEDGVLILAAGGEEKALKLSNRVEWVFEVPWDGPDPWEIAKQAGINIFSGKDFKAGLMVGGELVAVLFDEVSNDCYSFDIAVRPDRQKQGLGAKLMDYAIDEYDAISEAFEDLDFCLDAVNPHAIRMLKRRGFVETGRERGHTFMSRRASAPQSRTASAQAAAVVPPTGTSVGLFIPLPEGLAAQYPTKSEDPSPAHITLLYVGQVPEGREEDFKVVCTQAFSEVRGPVRAALRGLDRFLSPEQKVIFSRVRFSRDLNRARDGLRARLEEAGFEVKDSFPRWNPHVTIAYVPVGEEVRLEAPRGSWDFNSVQIWGMGAPENIPLGSSPGYLPPNTPLQDAGRLASIQAMRELSLRWSQL